MVFFWTKGAPQMAEKTRLMQRYKKCTFTPKLHVGVVLGGSRLAVFMTGRAGFLLKRWCYFFRQLASNGLLWRRFYPASWCMITPFWTDPISLYLNLLNYLFLSNFVILWLLNYFYPIKYFANQTTSFHGRGHGKNKRMHFTIATYPSTTIFLRSWMLHLIWEQYCIFVLFRKIYYEFIHCSIQLAIILTFWLFTTVKKMTESWKCQVTSVQGTTYWASRVTTITVKLRVDPPRQEENYPFNNAHQNWILQTPEKRCQFAWIFYFWNVVIKHCKIIFDFSST